jgi:hypothetical protein
MNLRGHEIVLGFLLATAIWAVVLTLTLSPNGLVGLLWTVSKLLNDAGVAVGAIATIAIAVFTWTLKKSTDRLWKAGDNQFRFAKETADRQAAEIHEQLRLTRENIEFARLEFNATHRPKLVIREARMLPPTPGHNTAGVRFVVANAGSSVADVVESHVELEFNEAVILLPLQTVEHGNAIGSIRLRPGDSRIREYGSNIGWAQYTNEQNRQLYAVETTPTKIWLRGFIVYLDNNRIRRRMAFCRGYDFNARRFRAGDDPEYEYSD